MGIVVKGNNDILHFHCKVETNFDDLLVEIEELLDKPLFMQDGYYPKAFFDFECRYLSEVEVDRLLSLLFVKKRVLFFGINLKKKLNRIVDVYSKPIRAGEVVYITSETLFLYGLNKDGVIYTNCNLYFLGSVKGRIVSRNENIKIYGHTFEGAQIKIMNTLLQEVTFFTSTMIYYKDEKIVISKEDEIWQEL